MTYNVFSETLNPTQSISMNLEHETAVNVARWNESVVLFCVYIGLVICCAVEAALWYTHQRWFSWGAFLSADVQLLRTWSQPGCGNCFCVLMFLIFCYCYCMLEFLCVTRGIIFTLMWFVLPCFVIHKYKQKLFNVKNQQSCLSYVLCKSFSMFQLHTTNLRYICCLIFIVVCYSIYW